MPDFSKVAAPLYNSTIMCKDSTFSISPSALVIVGLFNSCLFFHLFIHELITEYQCVLKTAV